jgi:predicted amino acid racemase
MNDFPKLHINLEKIKGNTKRIVDIAKQSGIEVVGVTKASCGDPNVGKAMLDGGASGLADSRISNIKRLKEDLPDTSCMLLRSPMISEISQVIQYADSSINTELTVIKALSKEAEKQGIIHNILLMAELGELREGIVSTEFDDIVSYVQSSSSLHLLGIGMNLTCFSGVIPTEEKIDEFLHLIDSIEQDVGIKFKIVSGGNTANIPQLAKKPHSSRINQLRVGEGILLGRETIHRTAIDQTFQDAFVLEAELIEVKKKPSVPDGELTENAFGEKPVFKDQGEIIRGIAAVGMQDTILDDLIPCDDTISVLGGSSDHLILQLPDKRYSVGDTVSFIPKYGALVHLFTSNYVHKTYDPMDCMN